MRVQKTFPDRSHEGIILILGEAKRAAKVSKKKTYRDERGEWLTDEQLVREFATDASAHTRLLNVLLTSTLF